MPEISVVMPVFNGEEFLPEAIDSILGQTFGDFEFIIVCEHGSSAESLQIVEQYAERDKRIHPVFNDEKLGISTSLNVGLKMATGKYIARMDGDDISGERRLEVQKLFLDNYSEIGAVGTSHFVINAPNWLVDYVTDPDLINSQLLFFVPLKHPTMMFRHEVTDKCPYDETLPGSEDYAFLCQLSECTKMSNILDPELFRYRRTNQNASAVHSNRDTMLRKMLMDKWILKKLDIQLKEDQLDVINILGADAYQKVHPKDYVEVVRKLEKILQKIEAKNLELRVYEPRCLLRTLSNRWFREKYKLGILLKGKLPDDLMKAWRKSEYYDPWF